MEPQSTSSLAEAVFVLSVITLPIAFGFGGALVGAPHLRAGLRAFIPFLAVLAAVLTMAAGGLLWFPEHPRVQPSPRQLFALAAPPHVVGWLTWFGLSRLDPPADEESGRAPRLFWVVGGLFWLAASAVIVVVGMSAVMPPRLALPPEARDIQEELIGHKMGLGHRYLLTASMSELAFRAYAERLGLDRTPDPSYYQTRDGVCSMEAFFTRGRVRLVSECRGR
ncbi:MAG: hypothetical protein AAGA56_05655 [Myxococcota bacterium]